MRTRFMIMILTLASAIAALAGEPALPPGHERYIVVLQRDVKDAGKDAGDETKRAGGKLEADLGNRLIITAPPPAIERLVKHAAIKYIQKAVVGTASATNMTATSVPTTVLPTIVVPTNTTYVTPRSFSAAGAPIESNAGLTWTSGDYTYDGAGNIVTIGTAAAPGTQGYRTYGYDNVTRLTKAQIQGVTPSGTYEYRYDAYGNRTEYKINTSPWVTVPVASASNRLTDATYDTSGNQLTRGVTEATYDGFGMVTKYEFDSTNTETYVYNANDERIGVLRGNDWTWSLRDSGGKVLRQYRSSSTTPSASWLWVEDFVYRDGLLLGAERVPEEGGRRHYHLDHLGTPRLVTGANGSVISEHDLLPFGEERTTIGQHQARGYDREEPLRFTGHERDFDNETPNNSSAYIDYMHARYYRPAAGRFLSVDPMPGDPYEPQSWNQYVYVMNNPMTLVDPTGMAAEGGSGITITVEADSPETIERKRRERELRALQEFQLQLRLMRSTSQRQWRSGFMRGYSSGWDTVWQRFGEFHAPNGVFDLAVMFLPIGRLARPSAGIIRGFTKHGINQVITRGASPRALRATVRSPRAVYHTVDDLGREAMKYVGRDWTVVLNMNDEVISVYKTIK